MCGSTIASDGSEQCAGRLHDGGMVHISSGDIAEPVKPVTAVWEVTRLVKPATADEAEEVDQRL